MQQYAKENLPMLGFGSSRIGFALPNTKYVLKVARNAKGIAQNKNEVDVFTSPTNAQVISKVFDSADDYSWIVAETVKEFPANEQGKNLFLNQTGLSFSIVERIMGLIGDYKGNWRENLQRAFSRKGALFPIIEKNYLNHPFIKAVENLIINNGLSSGDLARVEHWGKTADGRVVLLDYGLTKEIWNDHYEEPQKVPEAKKQEIAQAQVEKTKPSVPGAIRAAANK